MSEEKQKRYYRDGGGIKTLRDEIAIAAMQGIISNEALLNGIQQRDEAEEGESFYSHIGSDAYKMADAMLAQRDTQQD